MCDGIDGCECCVSECDCECKCERCENLCIWCITKLYYCNTGTFSNYGCKNTEVDKTKIEVIKLQPCKISQV